MSNVARAAGHTVASGSYSPRCENPPHAPGSDVRAFSESLLHGKTSKKQHCVNGVLTDDVSVLWRRGNRLKSTTPDYKPSFGSSSGALLRQATFQDYPSFLDRRPAPKDPHSLPPLPPQKRRVSKLNLVARWGFRRRSQPPPQDYPSPGPPDARNLGRLSKVLPFSVYELQRLEFPRDLKEGDYGADVEALQRALHTFGHMPRDSQITGYFGRATFVAVREWQRAQGLPGTGYWGPMSYETFSDVVRRHAEAQDALVTTASPTQTLAKNVTATVTAAVPIRLPWSPEVGTGLALGVVLLCAGGVAAGRRLGAGLRRLGSGVEEGETAVEEGEASLSGREVVGQSMLTYQGRWGRPETEARIPGGYFGNQEHNPEWSAESETGEVGREAEGEGSSVDGFMTRVGSALYEQLRHLKGAWNRGDESEESGQSEEANGGREGQQWDGDGSGSAQREWGGNEEEVPSRYNGVLDHRDMDEVESYEEIAQLQASIEALVRELSSVEVQRQAALRSLEEERHRREQLEVQLKHKVQAIAALQDEVKSLKASYRSQLTASHRE